MVRSSVHTCGILGQYPLAIVAPWVLGKEVDGKFRLLPPSSFVVQHEPETTQPMEYVVCTYIHFFCLLEQMCIGCMYARTYSQYSVLSTCQQTSHQQHTRLTWLFVCRFSSVSCDTTVRFQNRRTICVLDYNKFKVLSLAILGRRGR